MIATSPSFSPCASNASYFTTWPTSPESYTRALPVPTANVHAGKRGMPRAFPCSTGNARNTPAGVVTSVRGSTRYRYVPRNVGDCHVFPAANGKEKGRRGGSYTRSSC